MSIGTPVISVLIRTFQIHVARVPVAKHRNCLRPPMRPKSKLCITDPLGALKCLQGLPGWLEGTFEPTWQSLQAFQCPEWVRDAKLGFWAHWGPQAVPMFGDWYARNMYLEGSDQYRYHWRTYGHPSKFGFKD